MDDSPKLVAGNLSLDFHNTVSWNVDNPFEGNVLHNYDDVVTWMVQTGAVDVALADQLLAWAKLNPDSATEALDRAQDLRQVIHQVFDAVAQGESPPAPALEALNDWISALPLRLKPKDHAFTWDWAALPDEPTSVVWPVVWAAATLLQSDDLARVGGCEATGCGWLFVDRSRRHNRKWCEMGTCGNRAKAQRHYRRRKQG